MRRSNSEGGKLSVRRRKLQEKAAGLDGDRDCNLRRQSIPEYDSLTVKTLLMSSIKGVNEALYHQRQRMPGLKKTLDNNAYGTAAETLDVLVAAEAISPDNLPLL